MEDNLDQLLNKINCLKQDLLKIGQELKQHYLVLQSLDQDQDQDQNHILEQVDHEMIEIRYLEQKLTILKQELEQYQLMYHDWSQKILNSLNL